MFPGTGTFDRYIARQYLIWFGVALAVLTGTILLFEFIEMVRRTSDRPQVTFALAVQLTLLKTPQTVELILHFGILFSAMFTFWRLTRSHELVVARATGISAWRFLFPVMVIALLIGLIKIGLFNPMASALFERYEAMARQYIDGDTQVLQISQTGLWLRQRQDGELAVIFAERTESDRIALSGVTVFLYDTEDRYRGRIDAGSAVLDTGFWQMDNVRVSELSGNTEDHDTYRLETNLTRQSIEDSFADPRNQALWQLPEFIDMLDRTGFSSLRHRLHFQSLLAQPVLLVSMVMFAAAFSMRHTRRGGILPMVGTGIIVGFGLFVLNDISYAQGLSETTPIALAAWAPSALSMLIGTAMLLYLEDG